MGKIYRACIFNNMARFVFGFVFSTDAILKDFSALFSGLFRFVFGARSFVFNNLPGSFFKKGILFYFFASKTDEKWPVLRRSFPSSTQRNLSARRSKNAPRPARHSEASTVA